jgi:hypothetical protein
MCGWLHVARHLRGRGLGRLIYSHYYELGNEYVLVGTSANGAGFAVASRFGAQPISDTHWELTGVINWLPIVEQRIATRLGTGSVSLAAAALFSALANADAFDVADVLLDGLTPIGSTGEARADLEAALAAIDLGQASRPMIFTSPAVLKQLAMLGRHDGPPCFPDLVIPSGGSISGMPVMAVDALSNYSTYGDVLLVVDAARMGGDPGTPIIKIATAGAIQMASDPTESPPETAASMISLYQDDSTAVILERFYSVARPFADSVARISHVAYGTGSP